MLTISIILVLCVSMLTFANWQFVQNISKMKVSVFELNHKTQTNSHWCHKPAEKREDLRWGKCLSNAAVTKIEKWGRVSMFFKAEITHSHLLVSEQWQNQTVALCYISLYSNLQIMQYSHAVNQFIYFQKYMIKSWNLTLEDACSMRNMYYLLFK